LAQLMEQVGIKTQGPGGGKYTLKKSKGTTAIFRGTEDGGIKMREGGRLFGHIGWMRKWAINKAPSYSDELRECR